MLALTQAQQGVLRALTAYRREHGQSPSQQELGDALGLSKQAVSKHMRALELRGAIVQGYGMRRSARPVAQ